MFTPCYQSPTSAWLSQFEPCLRSETHAANKSMCNIIFLVSLSLSLSLSLGYARLGPRGGTEDCVVAEILLWAKAKGKGITYIYIYTFIQVLVQVYIHSKVEV